MLPAVILDPKSPFLVVNSQPEDEIHEAEQNIWLNIKSLRAYIFMRSKKKGTL